MESNSGFGYRHFVCKRYYDVQKGWQVIVYDTHGNQLHKTSWYRYRTEADNAAKAHIDMGFDSPF